MDSETLIQNAIDHQSSRLESIKTKVGAKRKLNKADLKWLGLQKDEVKAGRPTAGSQELPVYSSMGSCAAATGLPLFLIKQAKSEGCEAFRYSRVDLAKLLKHLGTQFSNPDATSTDGDVEPGNWKQVFDKYRAMREKDRWHRENQLLVSKDEVRSDMATGVSELYSTLDRVFCNELPPTLIGLSEIEIRNRCKLEINEMKESVRKRFESFEVREPGNNDSESSDETEEENQDPETGKKSR